MKVAVGCDHGGLEHKEAIVGYLKQSGFEVRDFGIHQPEHIDYPDIGFEVAEWVAGGNADLAILVCGTGVGMAMAANKVKGIRAAACSDHFSVKYTRLHNNANILCMGGRVIGIGTALELVDLFTNTKFEGGRHTARLGKIADYENNH